MSGSVLQPQIDEIRKKIQYEWVRDDGCSVEGVLSILELLVDVIEEMDKPTKGTD